MRVPARLVLSFLTIAISQSGAQTATLFGTVLRDSAAHPLPNATIELPLLRRTTQSDSLGNFIFDGLPGGRLLVTVRRVGFNRLDDLIDVSDGGTYTMRYVLDESAVALPEVNVNAEQRKWISSELNGFEERRKRNTGGYFIGDSVLSNTQTHSLQSLVLSSIPNLRKSGLYVKSGRVVRSECLPVLFIDGRLDYGGRSGGPAPELDSYDPKLYAGVEYYSDGATAPPRFNGTGSDCGVLILWSRERITKP